MFKIARFIEEYQKTFKITLKQKSIDSITILLNNINIYINNNNNISSCFKEKAAYILATVKHECGSRMIPIVENLNYTSASRLVKVWPSRFNLEKAKQYVRNPVKLGSYVYGNRLGNGDERSLEGFLYRGRGYVQITGKTNYRRFSKLLMIDLIANPDLALDYDIGSKILLTGMLNGLFTGKQLSDYITVKSKDYINARRVVNADVSRVGRSIRSDCLKLIKIVEKSYGY